MRTSWWVLCICLGFRSRSGQYRYSHSLDKLSFFSFLDTIKVAVLFCCWTRVVKSFLSWLCPFLFSSRFVNIVIQSVLKLPYSYLCQLKLIWDNSFLVTVLAYWLCVVPDYLFCSVLSVFLCTFTIMLVAKCLCVCPSTWDINVTVIFASIVRCSISGPQNRV